MKPIHLQIDPYAGSGGLHDVVAAIRQMTGTPLRTKGNKYVFPETVANGFIELNEIEPGLFMCFVDFLPNSELTLEYVNRQRYKACYFCYNMGSYQSQEVVKNFVRETNGSNLRSLLVCEAGVKVMFKGRKGSALNYIVLAISNEWMITHIGELQLPGGQRLVTETGTDFFFYENMDMQIYNIAKQLTSLSSVLPELRAAACKGIVMHLLSVSWSKILGQYDDEEEISIVDREKIIRFMNETLADLSRPLPPVEKLASDIFMSKSKFNTLFKKIYEKNVYQYYTECRMQKAMTLLRTGRYAVAQVANEISYQNLGHFSRAFSKYYGKLPKDCIPKVTPTRRQPDVNPC